MALFSQFSYLTCTTFIQNPPNPRSLINPSAIGFAGGFNPKISSSGSSRLHQVARATEHTLESAFIDVLEDLHIIKDVDVMKKELKDLMDGTERGLNATGATKAEIGEMILKLEAENPTAAPMEAEKVLDGKWILVYTTFLGLYPLLSSGTLPLLKVGEISQSINSEKLKVETSVELSGPFSKTSITTSAKYEVKSPKRAQIKFEEGVIGTPQITDFITIPENPQLFGQNIDLPPLLDLINSLQESLNSVAKSIESQPPFRFSLSNANANAESWLLTTYLDNDLRISKLEDGSFFVLIKEGSPLFFL